MSVRFDVAAHPGALAYQLLAGLVVPRPIALVTTVDAAGRTNAAPFSFFNVLGTEPPIAGFAPAERDDGSLKDTAANLLATGGCVIHLCDEPLAARMVACARALPPGESEIALAGFATRAAELVRAPILTECPVALECRFLDHRRYGANHLLVVEILLAHVRAGVADPATWRVDPAAYAPIGRMHSPDGYVRTSDRFGLPFPRA